MTIKQPHAHLGESIPLKRVREGMKHGGKRSLYASLMLTPMVDFLTIIVVFLLMSFSASGELLSVQQNLILPDAANTVLLERAPIVSINASTVQCDGRGVADVPTLMRQESTSGDWRIQPLVEYLDTQRRNWSILQPNVPFPGNVVLQCDKGVDFRVIKKIMYSCAQAGYANISFAVNKASGGPAKAPAR